MTNMTIKSPCDMCIVKSMCLSKRNSQKVQECKPYNTYIYEIHKDIPNRIVYRLNGVHLTNGYYNPNSEFYIDRIEYIFNPESYEHNNFIIVMIFCIIDKNYDEEMIFVSAKITSEKLIHYGNKPTDLLKEVENAGFQNINLYLR